MSDEREFDIALSFAGEDRGYVDQVANLLRDSGVKVFYDKFEDASLWGKNLYDYLTDIYMNKALYTIMFVSEHYAKKLWTSLERTAMQARAFQESQEYILPARFDDTEIPGVLPTTGYILLSDRSPESFVEVIHKKLINSGRTVPSESIRKALFSTATIPRIDPQTPCVSIICSTGAAVPSATVVAIADNGTTKSGQTDADGKVTLTIPTRRSYQLLVAHPEYPAALIPSWDPAEGIQITLATTENTGSIICHSTGYIPGLEGRLNPIFQTEKTALLYADNIAINGGRKRPAKLAVNEPFELEDSNGVIMQVRIIFIQERTSLIQFIRPRYDS
ncbi:TIR domain-containing protein [Pseudomonas guariconensis]|uniref:TIR domain-containing protein n=1 Tax=Pseudomonas guariconensis TaxID=1288410 RepID=UPI0018AACD52|nr:TIR domain-containing protein [Pseudomonas guariconensis]MBF8742081.1 toll/interleukin-1 receptor domain-containing protein [Pseudomonas guariconensis]MBF8751076.1 toll/interleukin-1 receptor domain-containing protein [Pseudomonas guariconensis]